MRVRFNEKLPSEDLTGRRVTWVQPPQETVHTGTVLADWRGKPTEDVLTRERTVSTVLLVEDRDGVRHSVPDYWIEQVDT